MALGNDNWNLALIVIMIAKFDRSMDAGRSACKTTTNPTGSLVRQAKRLCEMPRHRSVIVVAILLVGLQQRLHAADANAEWQGILAAAKKEGKIVIGAPPGSDLRNEVQAVLKKRFDLDSEFIQAPGPNLMSKIVAEKQAGAVSVDAFLIGPCTGNSLLKSDIYEPLAPAMIAPVAKAPADAL